jgi:hypothetical protein
LATGWRWWAGEWRRSGFKNISLTAYQGSIKGLVNFGGTDSYNVILVEQQKVTNYNSSTYFTFSNLAPGTYHVKIERSGYASVIKEVVVSSGPVDLGSMTINNVLPKGVAAGSTTVTDWGTYDGTLIPFTLNALQTIKISYLLTSYTTSNGLNTVTTITPALGGNAIWSCTPPPSDSYSGSANVTLGAGTYNIYMICKKIILRQREEVPILCSGHLLHGCRSPGDCNSKNLVLFNSRYTNCNKLH